MLIRRPPDVPSAAITPEAQYLHRREFLASALATTSGALATTAFAAGAEAQPKPLTVAIKSPLSTDEAPSRLRDITNYNNFIEFGTRKTNPAYFANAMTIDPWSVAIDGLVAKPTRIDLDSLIKSVALEERVYRLRCVEAWSMVIPWIGFPLSALLKRVEPLGAARYVAFETLYRPSEMRGQRKRRPTITWPYREGLRLD